MVWIWHDTRHGDMSILEKLGHDSDVIEKLKLAIYFNFYFYISLKEFFPFHWCVTDYHLIDIATSPVIVI